MHLSIIKSMISVLKRKNIFRLLKCFSNFQLYPSPWYFHDIRCPHLIIAGTEFLKMYEFNWQEFTASMGNFFGH